jgi:hypothetical protein
VLYTCGAAHPPHDALAVPGLLHTGVAAGQLAVDVDPELPVQFGVVHRPVVVLHAWPVPHSASPVHCTTRVALLVAPALVAVTVSEPSGSAALGSQDQVPSPATVTVQTVMPLTATVTLWPGTPVPESAGKSCWVVPVPPLGGEVSVTDGTTHWCDAVLYTMPAAHGPHMADAVPGLLQTGAEAEQSAMEPIPALARQLGVTQPLWSVLQTSPIVHWPLAVHCTTSVAVLVAPALVAVIMSGPTGKADAGEQVQLPVASTTTVHTARPLAVTLTVWPGMPVPLIAPSGSLVVVVLPAGGEVSVTAGSTHTKLEVL